jgi:hypothetical protein
MNLSTLELILAHTSQNMNDTPNIKNFNAT